MPELPFGRGYRTGPDARVNQSESWASRAREIPRRDEWMVSPFRAYGSDATSNTGYAQYLRMALIPQLDNILEATHARLRVTTSSAGSFVKACIYRLETKNDQKKLVKVPLSEVAIPGDSAAVQTEKLAGTAVLYPESRYFMCAYVSSNAVGLSSGVNTSQRVVPVLTHTFTLASSAARLPPHIDVGETSRVFGAYVPWVVFMSDMAKEILT